MNLKVILVITFLLASAFAQSQEKHKCLRNDLSYKEIIQACTNSLYDPSFSKKEQAWFAIRAGAMSKLSNQSDATVLGYFLVATEKGAPEGYSRIGDLYRSGYQSIKIDYEKALQYYHRDTSESYTKHNGLGSMYLEGKGVDQSFQRAVNHFSWALWQGEISLTARTLCDIFANEKNKQRDLSIAETFCRIAVRLEDHPGIKGIFEKERLALAAKLTVEQLQASDKRFQRCVNTDLTPLCHIP